MKIYIDTREHNQDMFDAFDILSYEKGFEYEKKFLEIGDVMCGNVIIERKEAGDFIGSIMDGRLKEQSAKMSMNFEHKYVIIEGNPFRTSSSINAHSIIGQITSLSVKHGIKVLMVDNPKQFAYMCYSLLDKHINFDKFCPDDFKKVVQKMSDEDIVVAMIYQIPGLGLDKAQLIAGLYDFSFKNLQENCSVDDLMVIDGIGKKTAEKVYEIFKK